MHDKKPDVALLLGHVNPFGLRLKLLRVLPLFLVSQHLLPAQPHLRPPSSTLLRSTAEKSKQKFAFETCIGSEVAAAGEAVGGVTVKFI